MLPPAGIALWPVPFIRAPPADLTGLTGLPAPAPGPEGEEPAVAHLSKNVAAMN